MMASIQPMVVESLNLLLILNHCDRNEIAHL
jgi:hypothetical protein